MKITYDKSADALYIYLDARATISSKSLKGIVKKTGGDFPVQIDFTKEGKVFGIEILHASEMVDLEYLKTLDFEG